MDGDTGDRVEEEQRCGSRGPTERGYGDGSAWMMGIGERDGGAAQSGNLGHKNQEDAGLVLENNDNMYLPFRNANRTSGSNVSTESDRGADASNSVASRNPSQSSNGHVDGGIQSGKGGGGTSRVPQPVAEQSMPTSSHSKGGESRRQGTSRVSQPSREHSMWTSIPSSGDESGLDRTAPPSYAIPDEGPPAKEGRGYGNEFIYLFRRHVDFLICAREHGDQHLRSLARYEIHKVFTTYEERFIRMVIGKGRSGIRRAEELIKFGVYQQLRVYATYFANVKTARTRGLEMPQFPSNLPYPTHAQRERYRRNVLWGKEEEPRFHMPMSDDDQELIFDVSREARTSTPLQTRQVGGNAPGGTARQTSHTGSRSQVVRNLQLHILDDEDDWKVTKKAKTETSKREEATATEKVGVDGRRLGVRRSREQTVDCFSSEEEAPKKTARGKENGERITKTSANATSTVTSKEVVSGGRVPRAEGTAAADLVNMSRQVLMTGEGNEIRAKRTKVTTEEKKTDAPTEELETPLLEDSFG